MSSADKFALRGMTMAEAARLAHVSRRTLFHARKVGRDRPPELLAAVEDLRAKVSAAAAVAGEPWPGGR